MLLPMLRASTLITLLLAPAIALGQACQTYFVDSNTPSGSFQTAINDLNAGGCPSGGFNKIIIDNSDSGFGDTVIPSPLPVIQRPVEIELFQPGEGARHVIRSNNTAQTSIGYGLRASARVIINDIEIEGGGGRAFWGGILLEAGADNSRVRGVKVENVRNQGVWLNGVNGTEIRRSDHNPVEIYSSGLGLNQDSPQFQPAILVTGTVNTIIYGAFLGVRPGGGSAGNCTYGIDIRDSSAVQVGMDLDNLNLRNHIGGNHLGGVRVSDSTIVSIRGNYIGLVPNGTSSAGNGHGNCFVAPPLELMRGGVVIEDSELVAIGNNEGEGNVITGNNRGIVVAGGGSVNVRRNLIGQRPDGQPVANSGDAIRLESGAGTGGAVFIGGLADRANVIRGGVGGGHGVHVLAGAGEVHVRANSIWDHPSAAIVRPAPPQPPVITSVNPDTGQISGTVAVVASGGEVDVFMDAGDQARQYLGTASVDSGSASFALTVNPALLDPDQNLTATYTRISAPDHGTSALSQPLPLNQTVEHQLTVVVAGQGTVSSDPAGIASCASDCSAQFEEGTAVTLTAAAAAGWQISGWSGCEPDKFGGGCVVKMGQNRIVSATFNELPPPDPGENLIFADRFENQ